MQIQKCVFYTGLINLMLNVISGKMLFFQRMSYILPINYELIYEEACVTVFQQSLNLEAIVSSIHRVLLYSK